MNTGIWNLEWLNSNSQRSYPLDEFSPKKDSTESFEIPDSLILAMNLSVHSGLVISPNRFYIKSISVFSTGLSIVIGYWNGTASITVASSTVAFSSHSEYNSYPLIGEGDFIDCAGRLVLGRMDELLSLPPGAYTFSNTSANIDSDAIRPMIRGVSSVTIVNGAAESKRLQGDIVFVAGKNMSFSSSVSGGVTSIVFNAISGEGLNINCDCADDVTPCIRTINGYGADPSGQISVVGDACLSVVSSTNGIQLLDNCSKPCCGCTELEAVTQDLVRFGDASTSLTNFLNRLEGSVNRMNLTVLGSRLGDGGGACVTGV